MKIGRIKELQHDLDTMHPRHPMTDSRPAGESTVRRVTPHYCGVCGTEVACVSDLLSERDTRIARAEAELKDERLAFAHANEVVGKLEADLAQLQTAEATIRELAAEIRSLCPDCRACARHAHSDATTPGFFYDQCAKHRAALASPACGPNGLPRVRNGMEYERGSAPGQR
jgi:hypothetical protein